MTTLETWCVSGKHTAPATFIVWAAVNWRESPGARGECLGERRRLEANRPGFAIPRSPGEERSFPFRLGS